MHSSRRHCEERSDEAIQTSGGARRSPGSLRCARDDGRRVVHVPRIEVRSLDETVEAVDLGQTPADVVFLSFSDSDLNALARAYEAAPEPRPTLRIASLAALRHPFSIDLYLERVCARARLVVARVLGGADYWRYGVDELAALARRSHIKLALLPGDRRRDARLDEASTLGSDAVQRIWRYFDEGGPYNMAACLAFFAAEIGAATNAPPPAPVDAFGRFERACFEAEPGAPHALIVFYRSIYLANDLAPIEALAQALRDKGFATTSVFVTSLKDEAALEGLRALLDRRCFDVVLNATAFSARLDADRGNGARRHRRADPAGGAGGRRRSTPGALRCAAWGRRIWRCMSRCRRSTGESSPAPFPSRRRAGATRGPNSARSRISRSPTGSTLSPSSPAGGRTSGARRRPTSASPASCRIIRRAAGAPAMRSDWIRPRAPSPSPRRCAPRDMTSPAISTRRR